MVEVQGDPVAQDGIARASLSDPLATEESKMMHVLVRIPETCGQVSVVRMTSANMAVLLVPSVMAPIVIPLKELPLVKMPLPGADEFSVDVAPTLPM